VKNKVANPFTECEFDILYAEGISRVGSLLDAAQELGIIEQHGAWLSFDGQLLGQGRQATKSFLEVHPELEATLAEAVHRCGPGKKLAS
jgi:recombination protein RecA